MKALYCFVPQFMDCFKHMALVFESKELIYLCLYMCLFQNVSVCVCVCVYVCVHCVRYVYVSINHILEGFDREPKIDHSVTF